MRKQISKEPIQYILQEDRGELREVQVIFWLIPLKGEESAQLYSDYAGVSKEGRSGYREVNKGKLRRADRESWLRAVSRVDNYPPSEDILGYEKIKSVCKVVKMPDGEEILRIPSTEDPDILSHIFDDLLTDQTQEIFDARANSQKLGEYEKKVSIS